MGALQVLMGLYATVLPFAVVGAWMALALWDVARREELSRGGVAGRVALVLLVPVVGAAGTLLTSPTLPRWRAAVIVVGGLAAYLVVLAVTIALGGAV